jgi:23S rRNA-/tRNA-specific pseudouridylate synthase
LKEERLFQVCVPQEMTGERLDRALSRLVAGLSRGEARRLIDAGCVFVDRRRVRLCGKPVKAAETLMAYRPAQPSKEGPEPQIVAKTREWVLLNKPVGMPVEPTRQGVAGTLVAWAKEHVEGAVHVAHRLDAATSGLILLARTKAALVDLNRAFAERLIDRSYLAVVSPSPTWERLTFDAQLDGKTAVTHARALTKATRAALLEVTLETGRTNQIRRHFADAGFPVVGDRAFGGLAGGRLLLHAARLSWTSWADEPPQDFRQPPGLDFREGSRAVGLEDVEAT